MDPAFAQALEWARRKGLPEEKLEKAKGIGDVYDIYRQWLKDQKVADQERKRKEAGMPSLRDMKAHGRIK
jgi:hypothetical protein